MCLATQVPLHLALIIQPFNRIALEGTGTFCDSIFVIKILWLQNLRFKFFDSIMRVKFCGSKCASRNLHLKRDKIEIGTFNLKPNKIFHVFFFDFRAFYYSHKISKSVSLSVSSTLIVTVSSKGSFCFIRSNEPQEVISERRIFLHTLQQFFL